MECKGKKKERKKEKKERYRFYMEEKRKKKEGMNKVHLPIIHRRKEKKKYLVHLAKLDVATSLKCSKRGSVTRSIVGGNNFS